MLKLTLLNLFDQTNCLKVIRSFIFVFIFGNSIKFNEEIMFKIGNFTNKRLGKKD